MDDSGPPRCPGGPHDCPGFEEIGGMLRVVDEASEKYRSNASNGQIEPVITTASNACGHSSPSSPRPSSENCQRNLFSIDHTDEWGGYTATFRGIFDGGRGRWVSGRWSRASFVADGQVRFGGSVELPRTNPLLALTSLEANTCALPPSPVAESVRPSPHTHRTPSSSTSNTPGIPLVGCIRPRNTRFYSLCRSWGRDHGKGF